MNKIKYKIQYVAIFFLLFVTANAQILKQGSIVITHSGAQWGYLNGLNCNISNAVGSTIEVAVLDGSNTSGIPSNSTLSTYPWTAFTPGNNKPAWWSSSNWIEANLGRVFGLTLSDCGDIYVANTSIRSGEGNSNIHDAIMRLDGITGAITTVFTFPGTKPNLGLGNIKYFKVGNAEYIAATWWEDNSLNILANTGTCAAPKWILKDKYVVKNIGIPYGIAYRNFNNKNSIYFGTINGNTSATIYSIDLTTTINFNTSALPTPQITVSWPAAVPYTGGSVCTAPQDIPIADISFSANYNKILFAQQGLCCTNQITAHNSALFEYYWNGAWNQSIGKYPSGMQLSNTKYFNTAGGVSYWNNILYEDNKLSCDTTALYTSDAIYVGSATTTSYPDANFGSATSTPPFTIGSTAYVYGFQAIKSMNNYANDAAAYNQTLKVDADDYFGQYDKWSLGDIEAFNIPLQCNVTPACSCGQFDSLVLNNTTYTISWPNLSFGQGLASGTLVAYYHCNSTTDQGCAVSYNWQVTSNGTYVGPPITSTTNSFNLNLLNGLPCGTYSITVTPTCGTLTCPPKTIRVKFDCPPPVCPCAGTVTINQSAVTVVTQNNVSNINPVSTATTSFTLTSSAPVSEVRMLIDEFRLTTSTGNDNCMLCKNKPQTWTNINSATLTGVTNQTVANTSALEKDIRELVFNNGVGTFFNLANNTLSLTLGIPGVTGLNCCTLKAEVCVKFVIRDVNCCETEVTKCFTFNLQ